jgi:hypothetical protein
VTPSVSFSGTPVSDAAAPADSSTSTVPLAADNPAASVTGQPFVPSSDSKPASTPDPIAALTPSSPRAALAPSTSKYNSKVLIILGVIIVVLAVVLVLVLAK